MSSAPTWKTVLEIAKERHSYYSIKGTSTLTDDELITILKESVNNSPTPFNNQSTRGLLILGQKNKDMWEAIWTAHKTTLQSEEHARKARIKFEAAYLGGYGTYVFFDDQNVVDGMVKAMPNLDKAFPAWVGNAAGILHYIVWTALECAGMGANLQHFPQLSPVTGPALKDFLKTPDNWVCSAMIPFGEINGAPPERTYLPIDDKVLVIQ
ncbi:hypothetical protein Q8F55_001621 [Vanrija albida]|uniref:Nitroreductase domain-containing protein n=1 Tax=Vanrija albida TaxID=181172 RepID=A0ABR3QGY8_9TREE